MVEASKYEAARGDSDASAVLERAIRPHSAHLRDDDIEQVRQDAVVRCLRAWDPSGGTPFASALSWYANWEVRNALKRRRRERRRLSPLPVEDHAPEARGLTAEQHAELGEYLSMVGAEDRDLIEGRYFGRKTYREIAAELGVSTSTAKHRLEKALGRLRGVINPTGGQP